MSSSGFVNLDGEPVPLPDADCAKNAREFVENCFSQSQQHDQISAERSKGSGKRVHKSVSMSQKKKTTMAESTGGANKEQPDIWDDDDLTDAELAMIADMTEKKLLGDDGGPKKDVPSKTSSN